MDGRDMVHIRQSHHDWYLVFRMQQHLICFWSLLLCYVSLCCCLDMLTGYLDQLIDSLQYTGVKVS
jgi:hypothetical protein